jgi:hypothetical protein
MQESRHSHLVQEMALKDNVCLLCLAESIECVEDYGEQTFYRCPECTVEYIIFRHDGMISYIAVDFPQPKV